MPQRICKLKSKCNKSNHNLNRNHPNIQLQSLQALEEVLSRLVVVPEVFLQEVALTLTPIA